MKNTLCPLCGKSKLREEVSEFRSDFVDDAGVRHDIVVPDVLKFRCDSCGEYVLDPESESRISAAQRHALGLLSATDLIRIRDKFGKSQAAMADLLGLGKKTWCRWESNDHFQSEAFDRYLRLLDEVPSNIAMLEVIWRRKVERSHSGLEAPALPFQYLTRMDVIQESEKQFVAMFSAGHAFTN